MPKQDTDLILKQPVSVLNKALSINYREFFTSLGKMTLSGATGNVPDAFEHGIDALKEAGLQDEPNEVAWLLISQALTKGLIELVDDYHDLFEQEPTEQQLDELAERVEYTLNAIEVSIDADFFNRPQDLPFLDDFKSALDFWLAELGWDKAQQNAFHQRLKSRFVFTLNEIWASNPDDYKILENRLKTPFTQATQEQRNWKRYNASLRELANERVFNEAFSLKSVYVHLNAYYEETKGKNDEEQPIKVVVDLHRFVNQWISNFDKDNALKVISGGPGCGKSSFSKILAAEIAEKDEVPVLFIPLQHFNPSKDLLQAVEDFVSLNEFLTGNPLDAKSGQKRLLIIFDGLDELSMQGKAASETAQEFVNEVMRTLDLSNNNPGIKRQVIITGRDLAIQANKQQLRKEQQILHMLPYFLRREERWNYGGDNSLLTKDLRDIWWKKFGKANGKNYQEIPKELNRDNLTPINREPLLNYLIALSYENRDNSKISFDKSTTLNTIYEDLLKAVYNRQWDKNKHKGTHHLEESEFFLILEEIALAIWHGNGRTATSSAIFKRCEENGLTRYLERFSEGAKKGVVRLLTAFYFREFGKEANGDQTFEFTHKSFGEYLTAKRIVRAVEDIQEETERHQKQPSKGRNIRESLEDWAKIGGATEMDEYLFSFIKDEIAAQQIESVEKWQKTFAEMLGSTVREAMPMEKLGLNNFAEMLKQSRHAEIGILAIYNACFLQTKEVIKIDWGERTAFGTWWRRIQEQKINQINKLSPKLLSGLDLSNCFLYISDFYSANFSYAQLPFTKLNLACLIKADLSNANLFQASLYKANLEQTNLELANLINADLRKANLVNANLKEIDLRIANLAGANLTGVNLRKANLEDANLEGVNLRRAKLEGANLKGVKLNGINLNGAKLKGTILERKNLKKANLIW